MKKEHFMQLVIQIASVLLSAFLLSGCGFPREEAVPNPYGKDLHGAGSHREREAVPDPGLPPTGLPDAFERTMVPAFQGSAWADVNEDIPFFTEKELEAARRLTETLSETAGPVCQSYGALDELGRCSGAVALAGTETLPESERESIRSVKPSGWHTVKYDGIDGNYLYNRCHLIGFQLTGQNANERNLITGTRFMNIEGMLPYEASVLAYVTGTGNHVLYRVTPVFDGDNLLADGVLMEACSIEDPLVRFCAFCFNVQPGIEIDYATGESRGPAFQGTEAVSLEGASEGASSGEEENRSGQDKNLPGGTENRSGQDENTPAEEGASSRRNGRIDPDAWSYIVNVSSRKFHRPDCPSVREMSEKNMQGSSCTRQELIEMGYEPCRSCRP